MVKKISGYICTALAAILFVPTGHHAVARDSAERESEAAEKKVACAVYHPDLTGLLLISKEFFLSAEAECRVSGYVSAAMEMRYYYIARQETEVEQYEKPDGSIGSRSEYSASQTYYACGPGLRLYPAGRGMQGVFWAGYYQLLIGTKHGLCSPLRYRNATSWLGYRYSYGTFYIEAALGAVYSSGLRDYVEPPVLPLLSYGVGISF